MREAARSALHGSEVAVSLHRPIHLKLKALSTTATIEERKIEMPEDTKDKELVAVTDVISALTQGRNGLLKISPHPETQCTVAVDSKIADSLKLFLVRTTSKNKELISESVKEQAEVETAIGKKAANVAHALIKKQQKRGLTGEEYVKSLKGSPLLSITKEAIKAAQRGDPAISGTAGIYSNPTTTRLPKELQCEKPQKIKVKLEEFGANGTLFACVVKDVGKHADFWAGFPTKRIYVEAYSQESQSGLLLSKIADEAIEVEVSLAIGVCQGKDNTDVVTASLIRIVDLNGLALRAIRILSAQMNLDFGPSGQ